MTQSRKNQNALKVFSPGQEGEVVEEFFQVDVFRPQKVLVELEGRGLFGRQPHRRSPLALADLFAALGGDQGQHQPESRVGSSLGVRSQVPGPVTGRVLVTCKTTTTIDALSRKNIFQLSFVKINS